MQNIDLRFFAITHSDFSELPAGHANTHTLYTDAMSARQGFDSYRGLFDSGNEYSIFFTPECYVITRFFQCHEGMHVLRATHCQISLAIKRDWSLANPVETFDRLVAEFKDILMKAPSGADVNQLFFSQGARLLNIINDPATLEPDPMQLRFNTSGQPGLKGVLAWDTETFFRQILRDPNRRELEGMEFFFLAKREVASAKYQSFMHILPATKQESEFARNALSLTYPDGHVVSFQSVDQQLPPYTARKTHYADMAFPAGSVRENMAEWSIRVSPSRADYSIGIPMQSMVKVIKVNIVNNLGRAVKCDALKFSYGTFNAYSNPPQLTLTGAEIDCLSNPSMLTVESTEPNRWQVVGYKIVKDEVVIVMQQLFRYDFYNLLLWLKDKTNYPNVKVTLSDREGCQPRQFTLSQPSCSLPIAPDRARLCIEPTPLSDRADGIQLGPDGKPDEKSVMAKFSVKSNFDLRVKLKGVTRREVNRMSRHNGEIGKATIVYHGLPDRVEPIMDKHFTVNGLPVGKQVEITVEVPGFFKVSEIVMCNQKESRDLGAQPKRLSLLLVPTMFTQLRRRMWAILIPFIAILAGYTIGCCFPLWAPVAGHKEEIVKSVDPADPVNPVPSKPDPKSAVTASDNPPEQTLPEEEQAVIEDILAEDAARASAAGVSEAPVLTPEQKAMVTKLKGSDFTMADVETAGYLLKGTQYEALVKSADLCIQALNLNTNERKELAKKGSTNYNLIIKKMQKEHQDKMLPLVRSESYKSTGKKFATIRALEDYVNENN